jgi:hypothetical protein
MDAQSKSTITSRPISQSLRLARSRICTPFETTQLSNLTLQRTWSAQAQGGGRVARAHFSPITTFSMTTQLVNFEPLPTRVFLPTMHRFKPTFSPR